MYSESQRASNKGAVVGVSGKCDLFSHSLLLFSQSNHTVSFLSLTGLESCKIGNHVWNRAKSEIIDICVRRNGNKVLYTV
jgi:hypothetical protein